MRADRRHFFMSLGLGVALCAGLIVAAPPRPDGTAPAPPAAPEKEPQRTDRPPASAAQAAPAPAPTAVDPAPATKTQAPGSRQALVLAGDLPDEEKVLAPVRAFANGFPGVILFDTPGSRAATDAYVQTSGMPALYATGPESSAARDLQDVRAARRVVLCPAEPRRLLLQAACLAGAMKAPLLVSHGRPDEAAQFGRSLRDWGTEELHAVGDTSGLAKELPHKRLVRLKDEGAVTAAYLKRQLKKGPIKTLVIANPADTRAGLGGMSALAPWIALQKRAALLLTDDGGGNVPAVVREAVQEEGLHDAESVLLVGNLRAIPPERRPNPIPGKDEFIETEPLTPTGAEPCSFAVGRLFHEDHNVVALMLARQRVFEGRPAEAPRALLVSNPGGGLPLLETLSRNTANEFRNAGYDTTALFAGQVRRDEVRRLLPQQTVFLWEGHHSTLIRDYGVHEWPDRLRPSLVFLQSCLALAEPKAQPFLERGAVAVVGSSTRTYSGSGGAFAMAYFDSLLYEHQSLGGALRQAKNFMLAFSLLKEKRLGEQSKLGGANVRSAWAFTLWGDPTAKLPRATPREGALANVRHQVRGNTVVLSLPAERHDKIETARYRAEVPPNIRLAGLRFKDEDGDCHPLVPFAFAEVRLPKVPPGRTPQLRTRLPDNYWVFCWDGRRSVGYLLVRPRARDREEIRFHVSW